MFAYTDFIPNTAQNGGVVFALSDRYGGFSQPPYEGLNLAFHTGDESAVVERNIIHMLEAFRQLDSRCAQAQNLAYMTQIHSTHCVVLGENLCDDDLCGRGSAGEESMREIESRDLAHSVRQGSGVAGNGIMNMGEADALLLTRKDKPAMVLVADCNPILFFDRTHNVAALIHAGREGVFGRICSNALARMSEYSDTRASDVYVFVGAGIRKCCYEVGDDVCAKLESKERERYIQSREGRYFLDLESMLRAEFESLGIGEWEFLPKCSCCQKEFFSYRRDGVTGRFGLVAMLV